MRIIAGRLKGRKIVPPVGQQVRPTSDRLRETIFNIIEHRWADRLHGAEIIDLFAGTGALGLEALSRGAAHVTFVEKHNAQARLIAANIGTLDLKACATILRVDCRSLGPAARQCDLAFLDPPYGRQLIGPTLDALLRLDWLRPGALLVVEADRREDFNWPAPLREPLTRTVGNTCVHFLEHTGDKGK